MVTVISRKSRSSQQVAETAAKASRHGDEGGPLGSCHSFSLIVAFELLLLALIVLRFAADAVDVPLM